MGSHRLREQEAAITPCHCAWHHESRPRARVLNGALRTPDASNICAFPNLLSALFYPTQALSSAQSKRINGRGQPVLPRSTSLCVPRNDLSLSTGSPTKNTSLQEACSQRGPVPPCGYSAAHLTQLLPKTDNPPWLEQAGGNFPMF